MVDSILVIGAGELGTSILESLAHHPLFDSRSISLTLLLRASSINSQASEKRAQLQHFHDLGIQLVAGDIDHDSQDALAALFAPFKTVVHAAGMTSPPGTQTKLTHAVLQAGVRLYMPWQHGVDYDAIGPDGGRGLFCEQLGVRALLRGQNATQWLIVSCGMFMSFLFEDFWGVVTWLEDGLLRATALNSWEDRLTVTSARDIGRCTAELLLRKDAPRIRPVFIAGETFTYAEFADTLERTTGKAVVREVWPLEYLRKESENDPGDKLKQYRVVFAEGTGLSWPKAESWNALNGIETEDVATWVKANLA